jgi:ActR/RegA family two-component response regulator
MTVRQLLVLDDDPWHVSWISDVAAACGFEASYASTFDEATAAFDKLTPQAVVVDIRIGDVDAPLEGATLTKIDPSWVGLRFLRFVRVERKCPAAQCALLVYTGLDREELQKVVENTFDARFFTKFEPTVFSDVLESELRRRAKA